MLYLKKKEKKKRKTPGDIIILHLCTKILDIERDRLKQVTLGHFLPFYSPNNLKNQNFEKIKKAAGDIIILHMCTINDNRMMFVSYDMEHDGHNFLSF